MDSVPVFFHWIVFLVVVVHGLHDVLLAILDDVAGVEVAPMSLHLVVVVQGIPNVLLAILDKVAAVEVPLMSPLWRST